MELPGKTHPSPWYALSNVDEVPSPALLVYPDSVWMKTLGG